MTQSCICRLGAKIWFDCSFFVFRFRSKESSPLNRVCVCFVFQPNKKWLCKLRGRNMRSSHSDDSRLIRAVSNALVLNDLPDSFPFLWSFLALLFDNRSSFFSSHAQSGQLLLHKLVARWAMLILFSLQVGLCSTWQGFYWFWFNKTKWSVFDCLLIWFRNLKLNFVNRSILTLSFHRLADKVVQASWQTCEASWMAIDWLSELIDRYHFICTYWTLLCLIDFQMMSFLSN